MDKDLEHEITNERLRFIAKILSLYTHEIKNHMAIINESVGLIGDIVEFSDDSSQIDFEQILELAQKTRTQIKASSQFTSFLNHFAHRMDTDVSSFGVNEALEELIVLLSKAAAQHSVAIVTEFEPAVKHVFNNPSLFQFLIFLLLYKTIIAAKPDETINIKTRCLVNDVVVTITLPEGISIDSDIVDYIVLKTGYKLQWTGQTVEIMIPAQPPEA
ncbi:hypothetical protein [Candidatus Magnetomonas plexicatena]|uniref:hypothetical protein n=1 Tax=Candidatus Magnetomonas plexicatena TaxID=2552947 RepID=UPI001100E544|nr:hypothetical protein E2O03_011190 [Nitrospirales bacterium LBB_01]